MKVSTLAFLSVISFSQAYALDVSSTCEIRRSQIKDALNQKTLSIRKAEKEMLMMLSPQIDQRKFSGFLLDIKDNEFDYKNVVISFNEKERLKELQNKELESSRLPTIQEISRHAELKFKTDASESDRKELQALSSKIQYATDNGIMPMSEAEKRELTILIKKFDEHLRRSKNAAQAEQNLNNYIRSEILRKVSSNPEVTTIKSDKIGTMYNLKSQNVNIDIFKDDFDQKEIRRDVYGYFSNPFIIKYVRNSSVGESDIDRIFQIYSNGKSLDVYLSPLSLRSENELNKFLKDFALSTRKTWSDFGLLIKNRTSQDVVDIAGNVMSTLDFATGKLSVVFKTTIFNNDGIYEHFPENYVSLEEMTELLLPKECRAEDK